MLNASLNELILIFVVVQSRVGCLGKHTFGGASLGFALFPLFFLYYIL